MDLGQQWPNCPRQSVVDFGMTKEAADKIIDLYQENASAWIKRRGCDLMELPWLDRFVEAMPPEGRDILDLGCAAGEPIARYLIGSGCQVTGVDGAAALIDVARESFPEHRWIVADMRELPRLGQFHGLVAWHSFFHLKPEDQRPMFDVFRRLSFPGAVLMFTSGTEFGDTIGEFEGQPLYHGSLSSDEYRDLLRANGFDIIRHIENDPTCGGANIWIAKKLKSDR